MQLLIIKYLKGTINELEEKELYRWLKNDKKNIAFFKREILIYGLQRSSENVFDPKRAFDDFKRKVKKDGKRMKANHFETFYKYAAAVIVLVSSVFVTYRLSKNADVGINDNFKVVEQHTVKTDKIILTLSDGTTKILGKKKGELSYLAEESTKKTVEYNEVRVPRGQMFRLILSDGTKVWLNSETKLKYPKKFLQGSRTRTVVLEGEAYFEVTHNKERPFIVKASTINVKVLGTKFNVSSYPNDENINTTLVEGSVNVIDSISSNNSILIKPNFQASFNRNSTFLSSKEVNTDNYIAWVQKKIVFEDLSFKDLLAKIERAYNIEIENRNSKLNNQLFTGQFDVEGIDVIFKALSTSGGFEYEITKNKVTIKK